MACVRCINRMCCCYCHWWCLLLTSPCLQFTEVVREVDKCFRAYSLPSFYKVSCACTLKERERERQRDPHIMWSHFCWFCTCAHAHTDTHILCTFLMCWFCTCMHAHTHTDIHAQTDRNSQSRAQHTHTLCTYELMYSGQLISELLSRPCTCFFTEPLSSHLMTCSTSMRPTCPGVATSSSRWHHPLM